MEVERQMNEDNWLHGIVPVLAGILGTVVGVIIALLLAVSLARAHDHGRPDLTPWFKGLQSKKGPCCDDREVMHLRLDNWETRDGHYYVQIPRSGVEFDRARRGATNVESVWVIVPDDAVITEPNLEGSTMVWPNYATMIPSIRCFMPGTFG
jgi:hypothetical protein